MSEEELESVAAAIKAQRPVHWRLASKLLDEYLDLRRTVEQVRNEPFSVRAAPPRGEN